MNNNNNRVPFTVPPLLPLPVDLPRNGLAPLPLDAGPGDFFGGDFLAPVAVVVSSSSSSTSKWCTVSEMLEEADDPVEVLEGRPDEGEKGIKLGGGGPRNMRIPDGDGEGPPPPPAPRGPPREPRPAMGEEPAMEENDG